MFILISCSFLYSMKTYEVFCIKYISKSCYSVLNRYSKTALKNVPFFFPNMRIHNNILPLRTYKCPGPIPLVLVSHSVFVWVRPKHCPQEHWPQAWGGSGKQLSEALLGVLIRKKACQSLLELVIIGHANHKLRQSSALEINVSRGILSCVWLFP